MNQIKDNWNNFKSNCRGDENLGWKCAKNIVPMQKILMVLKINFYFLLTFIYAK